MDRIIAQRQEAKTLPDGTYMEVDAKLYQLEGNARPYFSTTATHWTSSRVALGTRSDRTMLNCGAMTDEIARYFPKLRPVVALHLADDTGAPMYDVENGWYWYSDYNGKGGTVNNPGSDWGRMTPHERAAKYLRVDVDTLPEGLSKEEFREYVETLREQWQDEATAALEILNG